MAAGSLEAALWGVVAGSSFVVGGLVALRARPSARVVGLLTAVGAGGLVGAVAFELVDEAGRLAGGTGRVGVGLILGSLASLFAGGSWRERPDDVELSFRSLAVTVVPEAVVIVGALLSGHHLGAATISAVFVCGVPEAIRTTSEIRRRGFRPIGVVGVWSALALLCGITAGIAHAVLDSATEGLVAFVLAAAGGAVLNEVATELIPDARHLAGRLAGPTVVLGFGVVFVLAEVL